MSILRDLEMLVAVACTAAGAEENSPELGKSAGAIPSGSTLGM